jgi:hypothetical protein
VQRYAPNAANLFVPSNASTAVPLWYGVDVTAYTFPGSAAVVTKSNKTILDSGTTLNLLPSPVAAAYNARFCPPAVLDTESGLYVVPCTATAPPFAVVLGSASFTIDPRDQIIPQGRDAAGNVVCLSGTQDGGPDVPQNLVIL